MPRESFVRDLETLQDEILVLGSMVTVALRDSMSALQRLDVEAARRIKREDRAINEKRYAIEEQCLFLIASQQPMARDMRLLAAVLEIAGELERIGDYAKGISKIVRLMAGQPRLPLPPDMVEMSEKAIDMLRRALDAFVRRDVEMARDVIRGDDEIDDLYNQLHRELLEVMLADSEAITRANYILWAVHNLERTGDRSTNICERVIFTVTGQIVDEDEEEVRVPA